MRAAALDSVAAALVMPLDVKGETLDGVVLHIFNSFSGRYGFVGCGGFEFLHYREDECCRQQTDADKYSPDDSNRNLAPQEHGD